ncbi:MAG: sulfatase-like hydrolase/transferase, partial [Muribaculaceae bacterium]|nr:sulfatase-like hydrolase/transferase [Muribaculaceae bacterium]
YDNSIILFTSDHGDMMGDHNSWRKTYAYEGSAAIPMIIKTPASVSARLPKGSVIEQPVELRDVLPTFLDAAGDEVPQQMDGRSMLPLITDENPQWRRWIDLEHATCYTDRNYWCGLTDGKMKYIWFLRTGEEQLFDLTADPDECVNVVGDKHYAETADRMRRALADHLSERGDEWVRDGKLQTRSTTLLYSPNFPKP